MNEDDEVINLLTQMLVRNVKFVSGAYPKRPDYIIGSKNANNVIGSQMRLCQHCGTSIYLSNGLKVIARYPDVSVICLSCAAKQEAEGRT